MNEYPTGRYLRDAKLYEIGAGTSGEASSPAHVCLLAPARARLPVAPLPTLPSADHVGDACPCLLAAEIRRILIGRELFKEAAP